MNIYSDFELESDVSIDGASSFNCGGHQNYFDKVSGDVLGQSDLGYNRQCLSSPSLKQFGQPGGSTRLNQFDEDLYLDQYDGLVTNLTLDELDEFDDIALENRLLNMLTVTPLTQDVINCSRNLAAIIAKEAVSNRRLALLLAASANRKKKVLVKWNRKLRAMANSKE